MASEQPPGSTNRTPPAAPSVPAASRRSYVQTCVVLVDWWLERVEGDEGKIRIAGFTETPQMRKGGSSSIGNKRAANRVFRSTVARRCDFITLETVGGYLVRIGRLLNSSRTQENGFSHEVCECFKYGFPIQWEKLVNPNMEQMDRHSRSPSKSAADAPSGSVEYYVKKFLSDSLITSRGYASVENDFNSSSKSPSNTDGPPNLRLSSFSNGNTGNDGSSMNKMAASEGSGDGRMDMPEGPLTPPGGTCSSGEADDQHERTQIGAREQETADCPISSVLEVDGNRSALSKNASVEKGGYRSRVGCDQAEQDAEIHHENMRCSNEQEMVSQPVFTDLVNNHMSHTSSKLGEHGTLKCGKTSVSLGTGDALEVPIEGMTPQFGAVRVSEDNTVRRLRSGKVFGVLGSAPVKRENKRKRMQHEASNSKMIPKEGVTPTVDQTSHENGCSVARTVG